MPPKKEKKPAFEPKLMVLAKMTGFPAWPLFVMPQDMIPSAILAAKKKTTNLCVIFIPDGDYNWMNEKLLEQLTQEKLDAKLSKIPKDKLKAKPKKKTGRTNNVAEALVAANGLEFDKFMDELARQNKLVARDEEEEEEDEEAEDEVEESEEEGETESSKVRTDQDDKTENGEPDELLEDSGSEGTSNAEKGRRSRRKGAIAQSTLDEDEIEDEDDENKDTNGNDEEDSDLNSRKRTRSLRTNGGPRKKVAPSNGKAKNGHDAKAEARSSSPKPLTGKDRQSQLWLCRIKLQRSLIQRNQPATPKDPKLYPPPTVDELLVARIILHRLADFPVSVELLRITKIHKVLKCILKDEDLEYPDSFQLHEKCEQLLEKWKDMIESLKQEKQARYDSRLSSQVPEDSEISGIETKRTLGGEQEKVKV